MAKRKGKKGSSVSVDFSGVETRARVPEGDYAFKIKSVTLGTGEESGKDYIQFTWSISRGKYKGTSLKPYTCSLQPQALWNLKGLLENWGVKVPSKAMDLDLKELESREEEIGGTVEFETYNGKKIPAIVDFFPIDELGEDGKKADGPAETKASAEDVEEMTAEELEEFVDEAGLDVDLDDYKGLKKKKAAVIAALETAEKDEDDEEEEEAPKKKGGRKKKSARDDDDEDDDEEEETPKRGKKSKKDDDDEDEDDEEEDDDEDEEDDEEEDDEDEKPAKGKKSKKSKVESGAIDEMGKKELEKIVSTYELDVEITGKTKKDRRAVKKALDDQDLLEE